MDKKPLLAVKNFSLEFPEINFFAVNDISFEIYAGEILALVGESGSGKTLTALSLMGLEPINAKLYGHLILNDQSLLDAGSSGILSKARKFPPAIRGKKIALIPQDPMSALNPMFSIYNQLAEAVLVYQKNLEQEELYKLCFGSLERVGIADPERALKSYPHELSGGMRQRVMIAMALINEPDLLIADEPTTALDVTVQATILELLKSLGKTILFITHDLAVVAEIADRVIVMNKGKIVESNTVYNLFAAPENDYTKVLLSAILS